MTIKIFIALGLIAVAVMVWRLSGLIHEAAAADRAAALRDELAEELPAYTAADLPQVTNYPRGPWTAEDVAVWAAFLKTETGQRLYTQLTYTEGGVFLEAVQGLPGRTDLSADFLRGRAAGYRQLFRDLDTLATPAAQAGNLDPDDPEHVPGT